MAARARAWMSWSSGKDSAMALDVARSGGIVEVTALLSTVNADANRVAMHAVRRSLLEAQADRLGLALVTVDIPSPCSNHIYEARMAKAIAAARADGVAHIIFGDLFLRDVRAYREDRLAGTGISPIFPLWDRPTDVLAREMLASGLKAVITCIDRAQLHSDFAGRHFDAELLSELPEESTLAASATSSIPSYGTVRALAHPSTSRSARSWSATASSSVTYANPKR